MKTFEKSKSILKSRYDDHLWGETVQINYA